MRRSSLWAAAVVALGASVAGCSGGSSGPTVAGTGAGPPTSRPAGGSSSDGSTPLARAVAYARCMRSHGMLTFPDPVPTPGGGYGFRTTGIDPRSPVFRAASTACDSLVPGGWGSTGQPLSPAQQQQWLDWARCIRTHGVPGFADPTFSGGEVHVKGAGPDSSPQLRAATEACKSQMPAAGGLGG